MCVDACHIKNDKNDCTIKSVSLPTHLCIQLYISYEWYYFGDSSIIISRVLFLGDHELKSTSRKHAAVFSFILVPMMLISGCSTGTPTVSIEAPESSATQEPASPPSATPTTPVPTETPLPPTGTSTPTSTYTATPTPTSEPPSILVDQDATCRTGPGLIYDIRAYLSLGAKPVMLGHTEDNMWWMVEEPEFKAACWVSADIVTLQGDLELLPVFTPEPTPTIIPSPTQKAKGVRYFLIALNTGGTVGCGDSLIPVFIGVPSLSGPETDIRAALHSLFKLKVKDFGGLYNPLHNAHLAVQNVTFNETTGDVVVNLSGSIPKPKDECEYHRVRNVLWGTVRSYPGVKSLSIWIGSRHIGDLIAVIDR